MSLSMSLSLQKATKVHPKDKEKKPYTIACKKISKNDISKRRNFEVADIYQEVNIGMATNHRNVVCLYCLIVPSIYADRISHIAQNT